VLPQKALTINLLNFQAFLTSSEEFRLDLGEADLDFDLPLAALLVVTSWNSNFGG
jgi:hypothetical protein